MKKINAFRHDIPSIVKKLSKPIVLVGMMGVGKSHIGFALAQTLHIPFFDSDKEIEQKAGMNIAEIFINYGEDKFRESETKTIKDLLSNAPCVIASGGGALLNSETLTRLKAESIMVWLDVEVDIILERVKNSGRPLLQTQNPEKTLKTLMEQRRPLYSQAHIHIHDEVDASAAIDSILNALSAPPFLYT